MDGGPSIDPVVMPYGELGNIASTWRGNHADRSAVPFGARVYEAFPCRKTQQVLEIIEKSEQN
jgi:hypothetical protein